MDAAWVGVIGTLGGTLFGGGLTYGFEVRRDRRDQRRQRQQDERSAHIEMQSLIDQLKPLVTQEVFSQGGSFGGDGRLRLNLPMLHPFYRGQSLTWRIQDENVRNIIREIFFVHIPEMSADAFAIADKANFESKLNQASYAIGRYLEHP